MKKFIRTSARQVFLSSMFCGLFLMVTLLAGAGQYDWTWMKGLNTGAREGTYGIMGTPDPNNTPGGRMYSLAWTDAYGKFWLYGGVGFDIVGMIGDMGDLWKYDPDTDNWTWIQGSELDGQIVVYGTKGTAHVNNTPGVRNNSICWADSSGALWLFGGNGLGTDGMTCLFNDLWKYNQDTNLWTWMGGTNLGGQTGVYGTQGTPDEDNIPGARSNAVHWVDAEGKFWLFGGFGYGSSAGAGYLNDLWKYDPANNKWTWVKGSKLVNQNGIYGIQGASDINNNPGARIGAVSWIDSSGTLWLFGGIGMDSVGSSTYLNDLWKYNPSTNCWIWVTGSNLTQQAGIYGTFRIPDSNNTPGARFASLSWIDSSNNLWLFGGAGVDGEGALGHMLNDLWSYDTSSGCWTWMKGSSQCCQNGTYGTQGIASSDNTPGGRFNSVSWVGPSGTLWLFGGDGYVDIFSDYLNDLWKFEINDSPTGFPLVDTGMIDRVAGMAQQAGFNGDGPNALNQKLYYPGGIAIDPDGNVIICDRSNHRIRKVSTDFSITTIAGKAANRGYSGDGGAATNAVLNFPTDVAVAANGDIYFCDQYNQVIRKIAASNGVITTVAGTGSAGYNGDDKDALTAQLNYPEGIAIQGSNLFISDRYNNRLRKVDLTTGNITTVAGNGTSGYGAENVLATSTKLTSPRGLDVASDGTIYIAVWGESRVRKIDPSGMITTVAGGNTTGFSGDSGPALGARLYQPADAAIGPGNALYIADYSNNRIRKVDLTAGTIATFAGTGAAGYSGDGGDALLAVLNNPTSVAVNAAGDVFISDRTNQIIRAVGH